MKSLLIIKICKCGRNIIWIYIIYNTYTLPIQSEYACNVCLTRNWVVFRFIYCIDAKCNMDIMQIFGVWDPNYQSIFFMSSTLREFLVPLPVQIRQIHDYFFVNSNCLWFMILCHATPPDRKCEHEFKRHFQLQPHMLKPKVLYTWITCY
jgi:hypothetical protein